MALLAVDGVDATRATVLSGRYPFTHSFHLLLHGDPGGVRADFVRFARSAAGQALVARLGLVPVC
jgi:phosphate transport system substrate-binding protein